MLLFSRRFQPNKWEDPYFYARVIALSCAHDPVRLTDVRLRCSHARLLCDVQLFRFEVSSNTALLLTNTTSGGSPSLLGDGPDFSYFFETRAFFSTQAVHYKSMVRLASHKAHGRTNRCNLLEGTWRMARLNVQK